MADYTFLTFQSPWWFVAALLLYYLLTTYRVYLLTYRQVSQIPAQPFYMMVTTSRLHRLALTYLLRYKKSQWPLLKKSPVEKKLKKIDAIVLFLLPYLFIAFTWYFVQLMINHRIAYDPLSITLGQIQRTLVFINSIPFVKFLAEYKEAAFALYGLLCIGVVYLYKRKERMSKILISFKVALAILGIVANLSFFGAIAGLGTSEKTSQLLDLKAKITAMHEEIYRIGLNDVLYQEIKSMAAGGQNLYDKINESYKDFKRQQGNTYIEIYDTINHHLDISLRDIGRLFTIYKSDLPGYWDNPGGEFFGKKQDHLTRHTVVDADVAFKDGRSAFDFIYTQTTPTNTYIAQPSTWNMTEGERLLAAARDKKLSRITDFDIKVEKVCEILVDFGLDAGFEVIPGFEFVKKTKFLAKLFKVFALVPVQNCIASKVSNWLLKLGKNTLTTASEPTCNEKSANYEEQEKIKSSSRNLLAKMKRWALAEKGELRLKEQREQARLSKENQELEKSILDKVDRMTVDIPNIAELDKDLRTTYQDLRKHIAKEYPDVKLSSNESTSSMLRKSIKHEYKKQLLTQKDALDPMETNRNLQKVLVEIVDKPSLGDLISASRTIGMFAGLCPRCGLPLTFPICPSLRIR